LGKSVLMPSVCITGITLYSTSTLLFNTAHGEQELANKGPARHGTIKKGTIRCAIKMQDRSSTATSQVSKVMDDLYHRMQTQRVFTTEFISDGILTAAKQPMHTSQFYQRFSSMQTECLRIHCRISCLAIVALSTTCFEAAHDFNLLVPMPPRAAALPAKAPAPSKAKVGYSSCSCIGKST